MSHDELWDQSKFQWIIRNIFYTEWKFEIIPNNFNPTKHALKQVLLYRRYTVKVFQVMNSF